MSESCIRKWNDYANRRFGKIVYIGLKNKEYRSALGPECIGSHGCEQYCTENIKPILDECVDKNTEVYDARYYFFLTENIEDRKKYLK